MLTQLFLNSTIPLSVAPSITYFFDGAMANPLQVLLQPA